MWSNILVNSYGHAKISPPSLWEFYAILGVMNVSDIAKCFFSYSSTEGVGGSGRLDVVRINVNDMCSFDLVHVQTKPCILMCRLTFIIKPRHEKPGNLPMQNCFRYTNSTKSYK